MNTSVIDLHMDRMDFASNEAVNMLRENVQMSGYQYKTLSVTSAVPNEGKSYIAFRLAHSMAVLGKKTVFVDCDIRNFVIKKKYGITEKTIGLSEYLCGQYTEEYLPYRTTTENLDIIFSGKKSPNPSELLSGQLFDRLLDSLKAETKSPVPFITTPCPFCHHAPSCHHVSKKLQPGGAGRRAEAG